MVNQVVQDLDEHLLFIASECFDDESFVRAEKEKRSTLTTSFPSLKHTLQILLDVYRLNNVSRRESVQLHDLQELPLIMADDL